jgi:hypothetical protein
MPVGSPEKDPLQGRTALIKSEVRLQWLTIFWMVDLSDNPVFVEPTK